MSESLLDLNLDEVPELAMIPVGDHKIRCASADVRRKKDGTGTYINLRCESSADPMTDDIYVRVGLPSDQDDQKTVIRKKQRLVEMLQAFGITPGSSLNVESLVGQEAWVIIKHVEDPEYGNKAEVERFTRAA